MVCEMRSQANAQCPSIRDSQYPHQHCMHHFFLSSLDAIRQKAWPALCGLNAAAYQRNKRLALEGKLPPSFQHASAHSNSNASQFQEVVSHQNVGI